MPNSPEQSQAYNDEIDLADLIRALWQGKWLVIGVTLATLALGIAYLMIVPKSYTASLNILALPSSQADVYIELHETQLIATDKQSLLALFVEDLKTQTQKNRRQLPNYREPSMTKNFYRVFSCEAFRPLIKNNRTTINHDSFP